MTGVDKELDKFYNSTHRSEQKATVTNVRDESLNITDAPAVEPAGKIPASPQDLSVAVDTIEIEDILEVHDYDLGARYERNVLHCFFCARGLLCLTLASL